MFFWDLGIDSLLGLFFLSTERIAHAGVMTSRAARGAQDLLAGTDKAFLNGGVLDGVRGDTRAASAVGSVIIARVGLRIAISALGFTLAFLELVTVHVALGA
jgi:hypothetical protein